MKQNTYDGDAANIDQIKQEAFELGQEVAPIYDIDGYQDSDEYKNDIVPKLRRIVGYGDGEERLYTADDYNGVIQSNPTDIMREHATPSFWKALRRFSTSNA